MSTAKDTLKLWLERDEMLRCLKGLDALAAHHHDETLSQKVPLHSARYWAQVNRQRESLISESDFHVEMARLRQAVLQLITNLPADWDDAPLAEIPPEAPYSLPPAQPAKEKKPLTWQRVLGIAAATIAVLAGIAEFTGYSLKDVLTPSPADTLTQLHPPASQGIDSLKPDTARNTPASPSPSAIQTGRQASPIPQAQTQPPQTSPAERELRLQIKTDQGDDNLRYAAGDTWMLYAQATQPCYLRVIYRLADGRLVLLIDQQELKAHETSRWIALTIEYEVSAPYGTEAFYAFAQTQPFGALQTVDEPDGYTRVTEGLPSALRKIRGFKVKSRFAEDSLQLITSNPL